jgi:hypothetical protein
MANFVYTIKLESEGTVMEGIPVFGIAPLERDPSDDAYKAKNAQQVRNIVWQAAGARGITLAVPYPGVARFFLPRTRYETLTLFPNDKPDDAFNSLPDTYTFDRVNVGHNKPMDFQTFSVSGLELKWIYSYGVKNLKNKYGTDVPSVMAMVRPFAVSIGFDKLR